MSLEAPAIIIKKLRITDHAIQRAKERLKLADKSDLDIGNIVKSYFGSTATKYIGISNDEYGVNCHMYVNKKNAFYISMDLLAVKTIINHESKVGNVRHFRGLEDKIKLLYEKELRKIQRVESTKLKKLEYLRLVEDSEISQIKLKMYCTRSKTAKLNYKKRILELSGASKLIQIELTELVTVKNTIMKTIASTVYV